MPQAAECQLSIGPKLCSRKESLAGAHVYLMPHHLVDRVPSPLETGRHCSLICCVLALGSLIGGVLLLHVLLLRVLLLGILLPSFITPTESSHQPPHGCPGRSAFTSIAGNSSSYRSERRSTTRTLSTCRCDGW
jgi:hypothetical protein